MEGNEVVVIGLARSGVAAAEFLARRGANVVAADAKAESALPEEALEPYVGGYYVGCLSYLVEAREGALWLTYSTGRSVRLLYQGGTAFAAQGDPGLRVTFEVQDGLARSLALDDHGFTVVAVRMDRSGAPAG